MSTVEREAHEGYRPLRHSNTIVARHGRPKQGAQGRWNGVDGTGSLKWSKGREGLEARGQWTQRLADRIGRAVKRCAEG